MLQARQELLGHKNITMTMRHAHLSQEGKRKAVNLLNGLTNQGNGTASVIKVSQNENGVRWLSTTIGFFYSFS
jgi:hypothetical protein